MWPCSTCSASRWWRCASAGGRPLAASVLSVGALDYFFIPPTRTFVVKDVRHVGTFAVMLGVGWVVASLAERIRSQTRQALERERHTRALYRLGSALAEGGDAEAIQARAEAHVRQALGRPALVFLADGQGRLLPHPGAGPSLTPEDLACAQRALDPQAPPEPAGRWQCLSLAGGRGPGGRAGPGPGPGPPQGRPPPSVPKPGPGPGRPDRPGPGGRPAGPGTGRGPAAGRPRAAAQHPAVQRLSRPAHPPWGPSPGPPPRSWTRGPRPIPATSGCCSRPSTRSPAGWSGW